MAGNDIDLEIAFRNVAEKSGRAGYARLADFLVGEGIKARKSPAFCIQDD